jgi:uncharacterized protein
MESIAKTDMSSSSWRHYPAAILLAVVLSGCGKGFSQVSVFDAAEKGDLETVKAQVEADPSVLVQTDYFGRTLLQDAVIYGQPKVVLFLLDHGADLNRDNALGCAVATRQLGMAKLLLDHKANVDGNTRDGSTPLITACSVGAVGDVVPYEMVQLLLAHAANVNAKGFMGRTALDLAAASDRKNIVALLLADKASINAKGDTGWTPLHEAAAAGSTDVVELLLANEADIDAGDNSGMTPLDIAAFQSKPEERPSVGSFEVAEARGRTEVVKLLSSHKARYTIFDAAAMDDIKEVQALVKGNPALIFSKDGDGKTPLHYAASLDSKNVAEFLLAAKADVNAKDNQGKMPLECAVAAGRQDLAKLLLANGADVNAADHAGLTPLHMAVAIGLNDVQLVELLLAHGANVNARAKDGTTPLAHATQNSDIAKFLIAHGGHIYIVKPTQ